MLNTETYKNDTLLDDFQALAINFSQLAQGFGVILKPTSERALTKFSQLDEGKKKKIIKDFKSYSDTCESAVNSKIALTDVKAFTRYSMQKMGLKAAQEYIEQLSDEDLVEIYDLSGIQIFRNLKFFEITSYSIADLLTHEWFELYSRPQTVIKSMFEYAEVACTSQQAIVPMVKIGSHLMKEIAANPVQVCEVQFKTISAVYEGPGQPVGVIVNCQATNLSTAVSEHGLDFI